MLLSEDLLSSFGRADKERQLFERDVALLPDDHPYRRVLEKDSYPEEALRALLLRRVSKRLYREDLRSEIKRKLGVRPSADIQLLPKDLFTLWGGKDTLALYRPDTIWAAENDDHLLLHEMLHSVQRSTSGALPRGTSKNLILLTEALTEQWVVSERGERGLYLAERNKLSELGGLKKKLALFQGAALLSRLPSGFYRQWIAK